MKYFFAAILLLSSASTPLAWASNVDVEVFARRFELDIPITSARIYAIDEKGKYLAGYTDENGSLFIKRPVNEDLVLYLESSWLGFFPGIYSAYLTPGHNGLTGKSHRVTFQVPSYAMFWLLDTTMSWRHFARARPDSCQVVTTVTPVNKTLDDCPHGYPGAEVWLEPAGAEMTYYFDVFSRGFLSCKTDIFINLIAYSYINLVIHNLQSPHHMPDFQHIVHPSIPQLNLLKTSMDGGVMFLNVKARNEPYSVKVRDSLAPSARFTEVKFKCFPGALINISPPQGPRPLAR